MAGLRHAEPPFRPSAVSSGYERSNVPCLPTGSDLEVTSMVNSQDTADGGAASTVRLRYMGHAAFMILTPAGLRIVIDPFRNPALRPRWFKRRFPPVRANLVAVTHDHFDHNAAKAVKGIPAVLRNEGRISVQDVLLQTIPERHALELDMDNFIVLLETRSIRFCHLGDVRAHISAEAVGAAGRVDVLMISVDDSQHLLSFEEVDALVHTLSPRVVIPMHYFATGLTREESTLEGIDGWLQSMDDTPVRRIGSSVLELSLDRLPSRGAREVWVMDADVR